MNRAAIYCRLSDEDQNKRLNTDESESIQNQKNLLMRYALERQWEVYNIYSDDDYSGLDRERPEFNRMLKDAEEGKFDIILCKTQSRFTRDMEMVEKYLHGKFIEWKIRFIAVVDGVDSFDIHNKKSRQINGLINEWYSEDISESIKSVLKLKQQSGKFIGAFPGYGYRKDPKDKNKLIIDDEAAEVVRLIFELYLKGYGASHISKLLNEEKIPGPTEYKISKGYNYKNTFLKDDGLGWNTTTVKRILKNKLYIGCMVQHKRHKPSYKSKKIIEIEAKEWIVVPGTHDAIVNRDTFDMVQKRIKSRVRISKEGKTHIFSGKVYCGSCNSVMQKFNNGKGYEYLRCRLYSCSIDNKKCTSHSIRLDVLNDAITEKIKSVFKAYCSKEKLIEELANSNEEESKIKVLEKQLLKVERELRGRNEAFKNIYLDKVQGVISLEQYDGLSLMMAKDMERLKIKKLQLESNITESKKKGEFKEFYIKFIEDYEDKIILNQTLVNKFIEKIEIGEKDKNTGKQAIKVYWNF